MTQTGQVTGFRGHTTIYSKTHAHVILMQMNARQGYITYREKSNCTILKELRQLHNTKALMPVKRDDVTYQEEIKALND